jgi:hypothetical protein
VIVVAVMLLGAHLSGHRDVIFPEGAALAFGIVVLRKPQWSASRWRIVALPSLCAVLGHFLAQTTWAPWAGEICAVSGALLALWAMRSRVAPALSAAVLPVVFGVRSWMYPATVVITCVVIVAVVTWSSRRDHHQAFVGGAWRWDVVVGAWVMICSWILIAGPLLSLPIAAVAPPLFVSAFEWSLSDTRTLTRGMRRWLLVVGAALAGSVALKLAPDVSIAGLAAIGITLGLMRVLATPHAPALAISLVPLIAGPIGTLNFMIGIAVGAAALYLSGHVIAQARDELRSLATRTTREIRAGSDALVAEKA